MAGSDVEIVYPGKKGQQSLFPAQKRTCDEIDFCKVDLKTGEVKVLINEISKPYFNNDFFHLSLLNEGEDIIWWSERTGHRGISIITMAREI